VFVCVSKCVCVRALAFIHAIITRA
jgi:hypothetical protein